MAHALGGSCGSRCTARRLARAAGAAPAGSRGASGAALGLGARPRRACRPRAAAARSAIEQEVSIDKAPASLLRAGGEGGMRAAFEKMVRAKQDEICAAVSALDGTPFHEDAWTRPGGGGGISRVLQGGNVWEKAGVNVSVVYGSMPPDAYRAATGDNSKGAAGPVPFFAAGISSVMHPHNPMAPTMHFNYRYFETDAPADAPGAPRAWWFGGGTDLTPSYLFPEDVSHFHGAYKAVCDRHDPAFYPKFKQWADDYFVIKHRRDEEGNGERRGLGGIFFDDLNDRPAEQLLAFAGDAASAVVPSYLPLVARRKDEPFSEAQRQWQQLRRGRYVEFNLVYDRGTTFGLKTGGRIESILMSLPLTCRFEYDQHPAPGSREADLLDACLKPRAWV